MALSEAVKLSLRDAQEDLRNALACAARTEKPFVSKHIADMLANIDNLIDASAVIEWDEDDKRMDVIAQNGNEGLHYEDNEDIL